MRDQRLKTDIARVHRTDVGVYGIQKVWRQLNREGISVLRNPAAPLMDELELKGVAHCEQKRTMLPAEISPRSASLVERTFTAVLPNAPWVADATYVSIWSGFAYATLLIDVYRRFTVGWRVSN